MENDYDKVSFEDEDKLKSGRVSYNTSLSIRLLRKIGIKNERTAGIIMFLIFIILISIAAYILFYAYKDIKVKTYSDLSELEKRSIPPELIKAIENE